MVSSVRGGAHAVPGNGQLTMAEIKQKLRSMGVPQEIISKGKQAVMALMRENGKISTPPSTVKPDNARISGSERNEAPSRGGSNPDTEAPNGSRIDVLA